MVGTAHLSAGIVLWRRRPGGPPDGFEVLLVHPGGPYWARRDEGWWSIPKGEVGLGEEPLAAAEREYREELGADVPPGPRIPLGDIVQRAGKRVRAWAVEGDFDPRRLTSAPFTLQWPPGSGVERSFPEVDRAAWCSPDEAGRKLLASQLAFVDRLAAHLGIE